ncbi:MAG: hypothetical protein JWP89_3115 [Schlesneria sp.]|nr:hypothetical protein [Schlesneria sp.]
MRIDEFCTTFGEGVKSIDAVNQEWHIAEIDRMLGKLHTDAIGTGVMVGDALHGDGFRDQIPSELRDAFRALMHKKADSYNEMRQILADKIRDGDGDFLSFRDRRVQGFVSKLKGQIGENLFKEHAGAAAQLAESGCQEGWDVVVAQRDGLHEYVQVKLYANADNVIRKMREVHEKVSNGLIEGVNGETIERIDFAIPENIADAVKERIANQFPELIDIKIHTVGISATAAADIVHEGLNNVGPEALEHLFDELLGGTMTAGALHALANGFLWYKGAKDFSDAFADTMASTALSTSGICLGLLASTLTNSTPISFAIGIGGRTILSRFARSRWSFADFLEESIETSRAQLTALQDLGRQDAVAIAT